MAIHIQPGTFWCKSQIRYHAHRDRCQNATEGSRENSWELSQMSPKLPPGYWNFPDCMLENVYESYDCIL